MSAHGVLARAMTRALLDAARTLVVFLATMPSLSCMPFSCAPSWGTVITDYAVVYPDGTTRSFGGTISEAQLEEVLHTRGSFSPAGWVIRELEPQSDYMAESLHEAGERYALGKMSSVLGHRDGFCHTFHENSLCYETDLIDAIDLYVSSLVLRGPEDEEIWRTRVPFMEVPIYPYVVGHHALFVAGRSYFGSQVVIVDLRAGKIVDRWWVPGWDDFGMMKPAETYPYFTDGYIVIQGCKGVWPKLNSGDEFRYEPQETYVLKTTIENTGGE